MKGNVYTICFAAILGTVCATLLTGVAKFTEDAYQRNKAAEKNRNIFTALDIEYDQNASSEQLMEIYKKNIETEEKDGITLYKNVEDGVVKGVAVIFEGSGLWAPIKGVLALEEDMRTIKGITFYEQQETPGIGADIVEPYFRERFAGKKIVDAQGEPGIVIKAGITDPAQNEIDGISGATMTVNKINDMLNDKIKDIVAVK